MPAMTPLGIVYPCSGDTIDPGIFRDYAESAQAAISATQEIADQSLYPPAMQARSFNAQNFNAAVVTALVWDFEIYDSGPTGMFTAPGSTVTIQQAGTYLIGVWSRVNQQPANMTSTRISILINGVEFSAYKGDSGATLGTTNTESYTATLAPLLVPGNTVTSNYVYTGAVSPIGVVSTMSVIRVSLG